ncbi:dipeptidase 1-like isoform X4 [Homarus americanus]|nr:dipeptidase 1-like isoform X4 [Homarus americanus]XP_042210735.1 dipeptidase 1-like isoform X4 [Homarus americanus]XP_042210736.1 dipeptidase 1-like isoform X4 [Homarus americanus]
MSGLTASQEPLPLSERLAHARAILGEVPLVDGHNDLAMTIRKVVNNQLAQFPFHQDLTKLEPWASQTSSHTDLPRLRKGHLGGQFWSAWVPNDSQYKNAVTQTLEQIDVIKRLVDRYPDDLQFVTTADGILEAHAKGKIASLIGVEGGHTIDSSLGVLRIFYNEGVRYLTLTHTSNTPWADSSVSESGDKGQHIEFDGLSAWGKVVVKEMNRLGMLVDISHVASQTMKDVLNVTRAPVIFSHSNARAIRNITRNVPDDILVRLRENGGVAMVNFFTAFLVDDLNTASIKSVVAHINHIRKVAGVDHVGIGSDFDGMHRPPKGLEDTSKYPDLFAELLLDPSWTDEDLKKLAGLNIIRAFREVEKVRDNLRGEAPWDQPIPQKEVQGRLQCVNAWPAKPPM